MTASASISCMGGFCQLRGACTWYLDTSGRTVSERLCLPDQDGQSDIVPIRLHRPAGSRQGTHAQQTTPSWWGASEVPAEGI